MFKTLGEYIREDAARRDAATPRSRDTGTTPLHAHTYSQMRIYCANTGCKDKGIEAVPARDAHAD